MKTKRAEGAEDAAFKDALSEFGFFGGPQEVVLVEVEGVDVVLCESCTGHE